MGETGMNGDKQKINYKILSRDFIIVNVAVGGALVSMLIVILLQHLDVLPSFPCGIHEIFRVYCPGCGGTRALRALLQGHILKSLFYNPAIVLGAFLILHYELGVILTLTKKNGKYYFYKKTGLLYGYFTIVILFAVIRDWLLVGFQIDMLKDFF